MITVRSTSDADLPTWQGFVDDMPGAGGLHHAGWYGVLREAYRVRPYFLMATNDAGEVEGVLPAYHSTSLLTGSHISSLEGGVLARRTAAATALIGHARALCEQSGARYLQIRGGVVNETGSITGPTVRTIVATDQSAERIWERMKQSGRRGVRKGEKERVSIEHDARLAGLEEFYWVYAAHMRALGTPVMGVDAFQAMRRHLGPDRLRLYLVRLREHVIGGMLLLVNSSQWTSYFAAVHAAKDTEFANYTLYWHVLSEAASLRIARMDLGRSTHGSTVHVFKKRWGGSDVEVPYHFYPASGGRKGDMGLLKLKGGNMLPQRIWSKLPLPICNRLGPLLRKKLPFI